jgi:hypothetical protein
MSFVAKTGSWVVELSNGEESYEIAWVNYDSDNGDVQVQFADEDALSFESPEQFEALFAQVMTAIRAAFDQNKGKVQ